ncbi:MAG: SMC-Scp complex subunit ScpB [Lachnospiraceae bacterium]|nr:SMC-Scp complex subunit ScpB [Lachnospiraceae bacterium]
MDNVVNITDKIEINTEEAIKEDAVSKPEEEIEPAKEPVEHPEGVLESILFSMGDSVTIAKLAAVIGRSEEETTEILKAMQGKYDRNKDRGITLTFLEDHVQMCSKSEMFEYIVKIAKAPKNYALTDVTLETLSIIAYKQPVTRLEIEKIRGVSCDHAVNKLLELDLIQELGRLDAPGKPILFGTTEQFLRSFGVKSLDELPDVSPERLEEFKEEAAREAKVDVDI